MEISHKMIRSEGMIDSNTAAKQVDNSDNDYRIDGRG
jgi:hypothetical protein